MYRYSQETPFPLLADSFAVSIDELMGYDAARNEEEIRRFIEEHGRLFRAGRKEDFKESLRQNHIS